MLANERGSGQQGGRPVGGGGEGGAAAVEDLDSAEHGGEAGKGGDAVDLNSLPGVVLWLDATEDTCVRDSQGRVSVWLDRSGNFNHATQSDSAAQPLFVTPPDHARPTLRFDGEPSTLRVADSEALQFGDGDFAYLLVARWHNESVAGSNYWGYGGLLSKQEPWYPYRGVGVFANFPGPAGVARRFAAQLVIGETYVLSYSANMNDDQLRLCVVRRVGRDLELRVDGSFEARAQIGDITDVSALGR
jgi:hypothetical protein